MVINFLLGFFNRIFLRGLHGQTKAFPHHPQLAFVMRVNSGGTSPRVHSGVHWVDDDGKGVLASPQRRARSSSPSRSMSPPRRLPRSAMKQSLRYPTRGSLSGQGIPKVVPEAPTLVITSPRRARRSAEHVRRVRLTECMMSPSLSRGHSRLEGRKINRSREQRNRIRPSSAHQLPSLVPVEATLTLKAPLARGGQRSKARPATVSYGGGPEAAMGRSSRRSIIVSRDAALLRSATASARTRKHAFQRTAAAQRPQSVSIALTGQRYARPPPRTTRAAAAASRRAQQQTELLLQQQQTRQMTRQWGRRQGERQGRQQRGSGAAQQQHRSTRSARSTRVAHARRRAEPRNRVAGKWLYRIDQGEWRAEESVPRANAAGRGPAATNDPRRNPRRDPRARLRLAVRHSPHTSPEGPPVLDSPKGSVRPWTALSERSDPRSRPGSALARGGLW